MTDAQFVVAEVAPFLYGRPFMDIFLPGKRPSTVSGALSFFGSEM